MKTEKLHAASNLSIRVLTGFICSLAPYCIYQDLNIFHFFRGRGISKLDNFFTTMWMLNHMMMVGVGVGVARLHQNQTLHFHLSATFHPSP